jgi:hypothetical protein
VTTPDNSGNDQQGQGTGSGTGQDSTTQGQGQQGSGTGSAPDTSDADNWSAEEWRAFATEIGLSPAQVKERLGNARTWEKRAKENREGAQKASSLEQQLEELRREQADRDLRDLARATRTATTELRAELVGLGLSDADAREAIELIDKDQLIKDGEPDEKAISTVAKRLAKVSGRVTPDRDQGQGGGGQNGSGASSMNTWVSERVRAARSR